MQVVSFLYLGYICQKYSQSGNGAQLQTCNLIQFSAEEIPQDCAFANECSKNKFSKCSI